MRILFCCSLAVASVIAASPSHAATGEVIFDGTIVASCVLVVGTNGTLAPSTDLKTLSSKILPGTAGNVLLTTTGGVNLSVDSAVVTNNRPLTDPGTLVWAPSYSSTGTHTIAETNTSTALSGAGVDNVQVHLVGTKAGGQAFAAGYYKATVTVRCES